VHVLLHTLALVEGNAWPARGAAVLAELLCVEEGDKGHVRARLDPVAAFEALHLRLARVQPRLHAIDARDTVHPHNVGTAPHAAKSEAHGAHSLEDPRSHGVVG